MYDYVVPIASKYILTNKYLINIGKVSETKCAETTRQ